MDRVTSRTRHRTSSILNRAGTDIDDRGVEFQGIDRRYGCGANRMGHLGRGIVDKISDMALFTDRIVNIRRRCGRGAQLLDSGIFIPMRVMTHRTGHQAR